MRGLDVVRHLRYILVVGLFVNLIFEVIATELRSLCSLHVSSQLNF